jgi:hypothetical protein
MAGWNPGPAAMDPANGRTPACYEEPSERRRMSLHLRFLEEFLLIGASLHVRGVLGPRCHHLASGNHFRALIICMTVCLQPQASLN